MRSRLGRIGGVGADRALVFFCSPLQRATKIRRFFNLTKTDDVRKFVIRREVVSKTEGAKPYTKACVYVSLPPLDLRLTLVLTCSPKIQRLVTPERLQRRRHLRSLKRRKTEQQKVQVAEYKCVLPSSSFRRSRTNLRSLAGLSSPSASLRRRSRSRSPRTRRSASLALSHLALRQC